MECINCSYCRFPRSENDNGGSCKCKIMKNKTINVYVCGGETPEWCPLRTKDNSKRSDNMNFSAIKEVILRCKNNVNLKRYNMDFAKGYCYGVMNTSNKINEDEYNELARMIDDTFN